MWIFICADLFSLRQVAMIHMVKLIKINSALFSFIIVLNTVKIEETWEVNRA